MMNSDFSAFSSSWVIGASLVPHREVYYNLGRPEVPRLIAALGRRIGCPVGVTCVGKTDGGGAQVHAVLSVQAFCAAFGLTYVHTPFSIMQHVGSDAEVAEWERTFGLGEGHPSVAEAGLPLVGARAYAVDRLRWARPCVVAIQHCHGFTDRHPEAFGLVQPRLRSGFGLGAPDRDGPLRMAVHVRRGDVTVTENAARFTPIETIAARVEVVLRACAPRPVTATVYTQGDPGDFDALRRLGCHIRCDEPPLATLGHLARADILMTAKSSFSYVAALLSHGLVLYEPFWHPKLPAWSSVEDPVAMMGAVARLEGRAP